MLHVYEFEVFEDDGWYLAVPFDMLGGTQGETYGECCEMAANWLRTEMEHRAMHDEEVPAPTFGNEPRHGGKVVAFAVTAGRDTVRKVSASEAARLLGVTPGRVTQMLNANQLEGLPFRPTRDVPNAETLAAMREADRIATDPEAVGFTNVDDLFADLDA